jgi:hypothetical protein
VLRPLRLLVILVDQPIHGDRDRRLRVDEPHAGDARFGVLHGLDHVVGPAGPRRHDLDREQHVLGGHHRVATEHVGRCDHQVGNAHHRLAQP